METELPVHELERSGSVAVFENDLLKEVSARGQVRRHAHPVEIGHAPLFQQTKEDKKLCLEISRNDVSRNVESPGVSGVNFEHDVDVSGCVVLDGALQSLLTLILEAAAAAPKQATQQHRATWLQQLHGYQHRVWGKAKEMKRVQFFVKNGHGSTIVCSFSPLRGIGSALPGH